MKQTFILWLAAVIITFVLLYVYRITDENYPDTSTFGIEGKKVSYKLDKVHFGKDPYKVLIRTDIDSLQGNLFFKDFNSEEWNEEKLVQIPEVLSGSIPINKKIGKINYFVELTYEDSLFRIPPKGTAKLKLFGRIPPFINFLNELLMITAFLFAMRAGLEVFKDKPRVKIYSVAAAVVLIVLTVVIQPLYNTYKLGAINSFVPEINELIDLAWFLILILWIAGNILIFTTRINKVIPLTISVLTIVLLFTGRYF